MATSPAAGNAVASFRGFFFVDLIAEDLYLEPQFDFLDVDMTDFQIALFGEEEDVEPFFGDAVGDEKRARV